MATDSEAVVRAGLSSVTKGTLFVLTSTILLVGLNFVARVVIVRSVSKSEWDAFSFGLTVSWVVVAVGSLGLPNAIARSIPYASTDDERRTIVRATIWIGVAAALVSSVLLFLLGPSIGSSLGSSAIGLGLQYFSIAVGTSIVGTLIASIFQGYEDVAPNALYLQIVGPALFVVFLGFGVIAPPFGVSYTDALWAYALSNAATMVLLVVYLVRHLPKRLPAGPHSPGALRHYLRFAAPLWIVGVMVIITGTGDTLVLGVFHSGEVGTYTASLTLARLLPVGVTAAAYIFLPVASRFVRQGDTSSIATTYATVTKWLILISLPLFLLFFFLPSACLFFVFGPNYTSVVLPLQITVAGAFATTLLGPAPAAQVAFGQTRLLATNSVIAGVVDVAVAIALVPTCGYVGAAVAWCSANAAYSLLSLVELGALTGVHPFHRHFVLPLVATAVPVSVVLALLHPTVPWWSLPALGLGFALLFLALVLLTRSVDEGDRLLLEVVERLVGRPIPILRRIGRYSLHLRQR